MTPEVLLEKAARAVASAQLLLEAGDIDGACNRAYYAMFDAAKAALNVVSSDVDPVQTRTHSGLIAAFSLHLVKPGILPREMGRALNRAHEVRLVADYTGDVVGMEHAKATVDEAGLFVAAVRSGIPEENI